MGLLLRRLLPCNLRAALVAPHANFLFLAPPVLPSPSAFPPATPAMKTKSSWVTLTFARTPLATRPGSAPTSSRPPCECLFVCRCGFPHCRASCSRADASASDPPPDPPSCRSTAAPAGESEGLEALTCPEGYRAATAEELEGRVAELLWQTVTSPLFSNQTAGQVRGRGEVGLFVCLRGPQRAAAVPTCASIPLLPPPSIHRSMMPGTVMTPSASSGPTPPPPAAACPRRRRRRPPVPTRRPR